MKSVSSSEPSASSPHTGYKILIGTSGFSYDDWVGAFYPKSVPKGAWFEFYAQEFPCVEINASYYSWMTSKVMESLSSRAPAGFRFAVKLHRSLTHSSDDVDTGLRATIEQNRPLDEPIHLAQFPNAFIPSNESWKRIETLSALDSLVVEFRNSEWQTEETLRRLRALNISLCAVDAPAVMGLPKFSNEITGNIAYVRMHGRNAAKWYEHDHAYERYDYLYSEREINKIAQNVSKMRDQAPELFVFFNNHYGAQAVTNARQLAHALGVATTPAQTSLFD